MRLITGADIIDFHNGRDDLLVRHTDGKYATADYSDIANGDSYAYSYATDNDGQELRILLERSTIDDGEWFPDALDEDGNLDPSVADEMAAIINNDADLHAAIAVAEFRGATLAWQAADAEANRQALARAQAALKVANLCGGNQSHAARLIELDPSTLNKLIRKARTAEQRPH
ncbi:hypothetical protein [Streptomyces sp. NPDC056982]|uniref:hypothetical protein n=1 Tax=Streptomyces sp. NPDC056982 TaxID=3345986 RepID=UPI00363DDDFF